MADWLYTQSEVMIFIVGLVASVALMYVLAFYLKRTSILTDITDHEKEFLIAIQSGLVALSAILLSFSLVLVITNFDHVDTNVSSEASRINDVDRLLVQYGDPQLAPLRAQLKAYTEAIVKDEWPKLARKEESEQVESLYALISTEIGKISPSTLREAAIFAELLKKSNEMGELRETRIESSHIGLHRIYWVVNFAIFFGVLFMSALGLLLNRWLTAIGITMELAALIGLMTIVFACDQPFKGSVSIKPESIEATLKRMTARQK
jgi:hypothetical protein